MHAGGRMAGHTRMERAQTPAPERATVSRMTSSPRVSIGLPVFNGEDFLADALDSIRDQTYGDFELILSDNASTDATPEICARYAAQDTRIRVHRQRTNVGAAANFNQVFRLSRGEYFKWAAHDDLLAPTLLERCIEVLDRDPSTVLCHACAGIIDGRGHFVATDDLRTPRAAANRPSIRFADLILVPHRCYQVFGVIRTALLERTPRIASYVASDRVLLAEIGLRGRFHEIDEALFFPRDHPERSINALPALFLRAEWFDPTKVGRRVFPHWRMWFEYLRSVFRVPLPPAERAACCVHLIRWLASNWNWARLGQDLWLAATRSPAARPEVHPPG